jgi:hypothetical protein
VHAPVDDQVFARRPHRRSATGGDRQAMAVLDALLRHQAAEVAVGAVIARRPRQRQQPLRAQLALGLAQVVGHQSADALVVLAPLDTLGLRLVPLDDPLSRSCASRRRSARRRR